MRTRTRTHAPSVRRIDYVSPSDTWSVESTENLFSGGTSLIVDDDSPIRKNKPCYHERNVFTEYPMPMFQFGYGANSGSNLVLGYDATDPLMFSNDCIAGAMRFNDPSYLVIDGPGGDNFPRLADVTPDMQRSMFERLMPKVNDGLSVINFLIELKDLRRMFDFQTLNKVWDIVRRQDGQRTRRRASYVKTISNDYLNFSFGWKPFLGDLTKMLDTLLSLGKRLDYLRAHSGKEIVRQGSMTLEVPSFPSSVDVGAASYYSLGQNYRYYSTDGALVKAVHKQFYEYQPRYHASIRYVYRLPAGWSEARTKIQAYLDAFGVRPDLSIVWNAIPFSFVVDWVVDVGGWLRQFTPNDLGMEIVVIDASHSVKWSFARVTTAKFEVHPSASALLDPLVVELGVQERVLYEREVWNPSLFSSSVQMPTGTQLSLGGALGISRARVRNRRR